MRSLNGNFQAALAAIDAANAHDPTIVNVRGVDVPLALAHGQLATEWVLHLRPDASDALLLAARAHHLRRWETPRSSYPEGRAGYLIWRRDQKSRHALQVESILADQGYDQTTIARTQDLIRRQHISTDSETQLVEDAACLVFLETQLATLTERLERDHLTTIIQKTAAKMSPAGRALVELLPLSAAERLLLSEALA